MDVIKTQQIASRPIEKVIVHPLVLLSIVDNYNRVARDTNKRVVGVLLGSTFKGTVDITNSYAGTPLYSLLLIRFLVFLRIWDFFRCFALVSYTVICVFRCVSKLVSIEKNYEYLLLRRSLIGVANVKFESLIFTVPFEEDEKDPRIWFLDHNYHESMFSMFKRINGITWTVSSMKLCSLCFGYLVVELRI